MSGSIYAGFWIRVIAYLIDKVILWTFSLLLFVLGALALNTNTALSNSGDIFNTMGSAFFLAYYATITFVNMLYFTYFHGTIGQTPGKKLLGIRVIQKSGAPMTLGIAFLRWVGYIVSGLVLYLGFIWVALSSRKQGWHDMIAGTCVVKIRSYSRYMNNI